MTGRERANTLKAKWRKDIDKDFIREMNLDDKRLHKKGAK